MPILEDGNCGFRCIFKGLVGHEEQHLEIRQNIMNYVRTVVDNVEETLNSGRVANNNQPFRNVEEYISFMGKDKEYATEFELSMCAQAYRIKVEICMMHEEKNLNMFRKYGLTNEEFFIVQTLTPYIEENENYTDIKAIELLFSGNRESGRYELLQQRPMYNVRIKQLFEDKCLITIPISKRANNWITVKKTNKRSNICDYNNLSEDKSSEKKCSERKDEKYNKTGRNGKKRIQRCTKQMLIANKITNSFRFSQKKTCNRRQKPSEGNHIR